MLNTSSAAVTLVLWADVTRTVAAVYPMLLLVTVNTPAVVTERAVASLLENVR